MENITDALKMASAALLFVIAFSITMVMFSRARQTTDKVVGHINVRDYLPKVDSLKDNITREVGIETVVPTLFRYAQSDDNIQIRICDDDGKELQIFDTNIESQMNNETSTDAYLQKLKERYNDSTKKPFLFGAPWYSQGSSYILERINAFIYGLQMEHFSNVNYGEASSYAYPSLKNLKAGQDTFNSRFYESYLEYRTSGSVSVDEYGEEIVTIPAGTKIIITYTLKK